MSTAAHQIFGYSGTLGSTVSARRRREPKYSKQQQTHKIRAILSRRMMSPPSYEDVLDYVDSEVTYAENKREVLAIFGERSRRGQITNKDLQEMHCVSLHNQCASNGLETCQIACDECKNPAACKKAEQIGKEIKKHGRELTGFERLQSEHTKEAKQAPKKAKYSTGQTVKCREGYELQCGFSGSQKITQVKQYPDYVMYGIKGKVQGFVDEEWIVGVKVKTKPKKFRSVAGQAPRTLDPLAKVQILPELSPKTPKKKKKGAITGKPQTPKISYKKKKLPKMPEAIKKVLHPKTLTKNQQALLRKYRFVDISIQGKMYHITKQNVKDGKVEWYKKNGKVCLKNRG